MTDLKARIQAAVAGGGSRWFDGLAPCLARRGWEELARVGLTPETYGAARVLGRRPTWPAGKVMGSLAWGHPVRLEPFDGVIADTYGPLGLWGADAELTTAFEPALAAAMERLERIEGAAEVVKALVWSVIPVAVESPEYDTGFSDPLVPFSVVLGAHNPAHGVSPLRLAEGLLHEAMHLQLSLIEDVMPLVDGAEHLQHSPWQDRPRPTQGLLHGLYVFRVVQDFLTTALDRALLERDEATHARLRIAQIKAECAELADLNASADLTAAGRRFLARLQS